ncbi:glycine cleavage system H protein [Tamaricihabitans halophyticus]|uniref:Glycine cleavage system H protein n=1 Tax=Tamaricihabitans halophyticus TaxID=1262583 RepID=A0A4R2QMH3_9PSEU|nr:glycine cleavage system protein GcvH [Tamaricihabitans halophyticus]TCP50054.1 glycine cleavage system H protein [Tamaricihabitans halophyticus]
MRVPEHLSYTKEHEWLDVTEEIATMGLTDFAQDSLGEVVFVELPETGSQLTEGQSCGEIESTKSVSELYAAASGEVVEVNERVLSEPELVNTDPYGQGWLLKIRVTGQPELLTATAYAELIKE